MRRFPLFASTNLDEHTHNPELRSEWAHGKIGDQTYYYRSSVPEKIFWEIPDGGESRKPDRDEL